MLKFFQFSGTISGTTYFLRILFTLLLSIPGLIVFVSLISSYMIGEGIIDVNNPESFDQSAIEKIEENPDEFLSELWSYVSTGWLFSILLAFLPAIWFSLATAYKRISSLFFDNRNNIFGIYVAIEIFADAIGLGILSSLSFLKTPMSIITIAIFFFLALKNSEIDKDDHEG